MSMQCVMAFIYRFQANKEPVYLLLRRNPKLGAYWQPVTGFVEKNEPLRQAALREIEEETGFHHPRKILEIDYRFSFTMEDIDVHCDVDVLAVEVEETRVQLSFEHTAYRWLEYQAARKTLHWENNKKALDLLHQLLQNNT